MSCGRVRAESRACQAQGQHRFRHAYRTHLAEGRLIHRHRAHLRFPLRPGPRIPKDLSRLDLPSQTFAPNHELSAFPAVARLQNCDPSLSRDRNVCSFGSVSRSAELLVAESSPQVPARYGSEWSPILRQLRYNKSSSVDIRDCSLQPDIAQR